MISVAAVHAIAGGISLACIILIVLLAIVFLIVAKRPGTGPVTVGAISLILAGITLINLIIFGCVWLNSFI